MQTHCWEENIVSSHSEASLLSFVLESISCTTQCCKRHYCHLSMPIYMHPSKFNLPAREFELKLLFCYLHCSNSIVTLIFYSHCHFEVPFKLYHSELFRGLQRSPRRMSSVLEDTNFLQSQYWKEVLVWEGICLTEESVMEERQTTLNNKNELQSLYRGLRGKKY